MKFPNSKVQKHYYMGMMLYMFAGILLLIGAMHEYAALVEMYFGSLSWLVVSSMVVECVTNSVLIMTAFVDVAIQGLIRLRALNG